MRLAQGVDRVAIEVGNGFAHHLVGRAGVEFHVARHGHRVRAPLLERLTDVERLDVGELVDPFRDQFGEFREQPPAFSRRQLAPVAGKRLACRLDRRVNIGCLSARDFADLHATRRVFDRQALARLRLDPAPVDEALVGREPGRYR